MTEAATLADAVVTALLAALGADLVRTGDAIDPRFHQDWAGYPATRPKALVLPRTTEDVSAALRICSAHGQGVVTQGGLTGLAGGAHPGPDDVALSLSRMVGVEEVDVSSATLTALAGTPLEQLHQAAEAAGFACGIDLGARGSCTIGGNVATNAGGINVLRYGMTRQNVRGLEVVLADGTVVQSLNKLIKNNTGYDWPQLFIGAEGTLGVVTRVVLALHPPVRSRQTALCAIRDFDAALSILRFLEQEIPGQLLAFEAMWPDFYGFATRTAERTAPLPGDAPLYLLIETSLPDQDSLEAPLAVLFERGLMHDAVLAKSEEERRKLWAIREVPAEYAQHFRGGSVKFDVGIPLGHMGEAVRSLRALIDTTWPEATAVFYGHVADSNLHLVLGRLDGGALPHHEIEDAVYGIVSRFDGSVSAEHGIGFSKKAYLPLSRSPEELGLMRLIKNAIDPLGLMNPGKVL
jgi:FAD/FMN-containing dehydrogenase